MCLRKTPSEGILGTVNCSISGCKFQRHTKGKNPVVHIESSKETCIEFEFDWSEHVGRWIRQWEEYWASLSLVDRFEALRRVGHKMSRAEHAEMRHLEVHLNRGEVVCTCGKPE